MGTHVFRTEALLLVLPTTEYQKRVPVTIGTSLTDMAVDFLGQDSQLPSNIQCTPTYCTLEPGSNQVTVGLRNISARKITIPSKTIVCQLQLANTIPPMHTPTEQPPSEVKREDDPCIPDQLDLGKLSTWSEEQQYAARKLLCDYADTFSKMI